MRIKKEEQIKRILESRDWIDKTFHGEYINSKKPFLVRCINCKTEILLKDTNHIFTENRYMKCPECEKENSRFSKYLEIKPKCKICEKPLTFNQFIDNNYFCSRECANSSRILNGPLVRIKSLTESDIKELENIGFNSLNELIRYLDLENSLSVRTRKLFKEKIGNFKFRKHDFIKKEDLIKFLNENKSIQEIAAIRNMTDEQVTRDLKNNKLWGKEKVKTKIRTDIREINENTYEKNKREFLNLLVSGHYTRTTRIRNGLIKFGLKEHKCECCGRTTWNGRPIPIDVHHIDGDNSNNSIENLQILCSNCHRQTDNFGSLNKGRKKKIYNFSK